VKGQKNDYNDAEAIAEAALRPNLRTVREKTQDQLDLQALRLVSQASRSGLERGLCATRSWQFWRTRKTRYHPGCAA
jgi:transposase